MKKTICMFLAAVCVLALGSLPPAAAEGEQAFDLQTAFDNGALALRDIPFPSADEQYEMRFPADWENAAMLFADDTIGAQYTKDGAWIAFIADGSQLGLSAGYFSPDGSKALCMMGDSVFLAEGNTITMIRSGDGRSVEDSYGSFATFKKRYTDTWVGTEGLAWSPDGRYAAITNSLSVLTLMKLIYGVYVIDTQACELLCLETYPSDWRNGGRSVLQTCFDATGSILYYQLYGRASADDSNLLALYQYDMKTGDKRKLYGRDDWNMSMPMLQRDTLGRLWNLMYSNILEDHSGLNLYAPQGEAWSVTPYPLSEPMSALYPIFMELGAQDTGVTLVQLNRNRQLSMQLPVLFHITEDAVNYQGIVLIDSMDAQSAQLMPPDAFMEPEAVTQLQKNDTPQCMNCKLSPDGRYAMLLMRTRSDYAFLLLDTQTLALVHVQASPQLASPFAVLDAPMSKEYPTGYTWASGSRLAVNTSDGVKLCELYVP